MGSTNALAAYAHWADQLPHRARHVLVMMALRSLDHEGEKGQPARLYFAGPDELATAIGYDRSTEAARKTTLRKVQADIATLVAAGALERVVRGHTGNRAVYRLVLPSMPVTGMQKGARDGHAQGARDGHAQGARDGHAYEYLGTTEDNEKEPESSSPPVPHQGPADATHADDDDNEYAAALRTLEPLPTGRYLELKRQARNTLGPAAFERDIVIAAAAKHEAANR